MNYLVLLTLIIVNTAMKLKLTFGPEQQKCFYQALTTKQKYSVIITPLTDGTYELDINHQLDGEWKHSVTRQINTSKEITTLHKFASHDAIYSFCVINSGRQNFTARVQIKWGLQLLDLHILAEENDQEMLQRQAKWLDKRADKILQTISVSNNLISSKQELQNLMSVKLISYAIIGVITVVVINGYFYYSLKKTFQERKMI